MPDIVKGDLVLEPGQRVYVRRGQGDKTISFAVADSDTLIDPMLVMEAVALGLFRFNSDTEETQAENENEIVIGPADINAFPSPIARHFWYEPVMPIALFTFFGDEGGQCQGILPTWGR